MAEAFADGRATEAERKAAQGRVDATLDEEGQQDPLRVAVSWALVRPDGWLVAFGAEVASSGSRGVVKGPRLQRRHAELIRDIFGNPFRPVTFDPAWQTSTVVALAQQMYESRDFSAMPILADAIQDAGCEDTQVLDHCRSANLHVRGCWVVDWVLGKN